MADSVTYLMDTYELAFDALPGGVVILDGGGIVVAVNREIERQFGYARQDLVGQQVDVLLNEGGRTITAACSEVAQASDATTVRGEIVTGRRKDGSEFSASIGLRRFQMEDRSLLVASVSDMTAPNQADDAQRAALEERLALELFMVDLSREFINLPSNQIEDAIRRGLGRACELLGLDRGTFVRVGPDGTFLNPLSWSSESVASIDATTVTPERFPWTTERLLAGDVVSFTTRDDVPHEIDRANFAALGTESFISVPLSTEDRVTAVMGFGAVHTNRALPPELVHRLTVIASVFTQAVARQHRDEMLQKAVEEAQQLKQQLQMENVYLRHEARERGGPTEIVGTSAALKRILAQAQQVATTDSTVLLLGETGTGKELFATHIHSLGARRGRPMVRVNCAAIPATLVESELFGREKGAFTGALARQVGRFELADHSTIFLDEIGDLPLEVQVKLLRVLEERRFERLGNPRPISVDTRIIAATHRNLEQRIADGAFREDLYYRLNVFPIHVPPLRERLEDIPLLISEFVEEFSRAFGKRIDVIDRDSLAALQRYSWPGNIRELRNVVERAMIVTTSRRLTIRLPDSPAPVTMHSSKLVDVEREHILAVLKNSAWRIRGTGGAADRLGMKPTTLETRMAKLGLKRPEA